MKATMHIRGRSLVRTVKHPETVKRLGVYSALGRVLVTRQCQTSRQANTFTATLELWHEATKPPSHQNSLSKIDR